MHRGHSHQQLGIKPEHQVIIGSAPLPPSSLQVHLPFFLGQVSGVKMAALISSESGVAPAEAGWEGVGPNTIVQTE
ncbi:hypothetical protein Pmani_039664 [Petrolisthes manimaculis]|uniref:Uncharacterized protein n=1 Tax=Petrolisthes manimaculis TaxID=1843537 RepID=A0AAE1NDI2_9EUCA|nr:hypothetical protein Pmani_039664 [Petrolisthes manimaculis]